MTAQPRQSILRFFWMNGRINALLQADQVLFHSVPLPPSVIVLTGFRARHDPPRTPFQLESLAILISRSVASPSGIDFKESLDQLHMRTSSRARDGRRHKADSNASSVAPASPSHSAPFIPCPIWRRIGAASEDDLAEGGWRQVEDRRDVVRVHELLQLYTGRKDIKSLRERE